MRQRRCPSPGLRFSPLALSSASGPLHVLCMPIGVQITDEDPTHRPLGRFASRATGQALLGSVDTLVDCSRLSVFCLGNVWLQAGPLEPRRKAASGGSPVQDPRPTEAPFLVFEVLGGGPSSFSSAHEAPWKAAVRAAIADAGVAVRDTRFGVSIALRTPVSANANEVWDLDNLVKPTLDAMEGVFGPRPGWDGHSQQMIESTTYRPPRGQLEVQRRSGRVGIARTQQVISDPIASCRWHRRLLPGRRASYPGRVAGVNAGRGNRDAAPYRPRPRRDPTARGTRGVEVNGWAAAVAPSAVAGRPGCVGTASPRSPRKATEAPPPSRGACPATGRCCSWC
jgi:hypothetical protein